MVDNAVRSQHESCLISLFKTIRRHTDDPAVKRHGIQIKKGTMYAYARMPQPVQQGKGPRHRFVKHVQVVGNAEVDQFQTGSGKGKDIPKFFFRHQL